MLLGASGRLAQNPQNLGKLLGDLLYVADTGAFKVPLVLLAAAGSLPLWSAGAEQSTDVLDSLGKLRQATLLHKDRLAGTILMLKLDLLLAFGTPTQPRERVETLYRALVAFAGPSRQAPVEEWKGVVLNAAEVGLNEADGCEHADEARRFFTMISNKLRAAPPENPWGELFRRYTQESPQDAIVSTKKSPAMRRAARTN